MTAKALLQSAGDGTAVPAGRIGEKITWASTPVNQSATLTETDWANANIVLTPGVWDVRALLQGEVNKGATNAGDGVLVFKITDASNTIVDSQEGSLYIYINATTEVINRGKVSLGFIANLTTTTTYKIRIFKGSTPGSTATALSGTSPIYSQFYAIRIA